MLWDGSRIARLSEVTNELVPLIYDNDGEFYRRVVMMPLEELTPLVAYWSTVIKAMTKAMRPIDEHGRLTKVEYDTLHTLAESYAIDDEANIVMSLLAMSDSDDDRVELKAQLDVLKATSWHRLASVMRVLAVMMGALLAATPLGNEQSLVLRAATLRLMASHVRVVVQEIEWCSECLPHAHRIMSLLDDKHVSTPIDDILGKEDGDGRRKD